MSTDLIADVLARFRAEVFPQLSSPAVSLIEGQLFCEGDECMAIDDALQDSLLEGVQLAPDLLDDAEAAVNWFWDPDITTERTLGFIAQHRQRLAA